MILSKNDCQILRLTEHFYNAYPNPPCVEILQKRQRAYACLLFQMHNYFVWIVIIKDIKYLENQEGFTKIYRGLYSAYKRKKKASFEGILP